MQLKGNHKIIGRDGMRSIQKRITQFPRKPASYPIMLASASFLWLSLCIASNPLQVQATVLDQSAESTEETYIRHTIQPGDSLAAIALQYGVPMPLLMQINNIEDPNLIFIGQQLLIPTLLTATSTPNETATALPSITALSTLTATPLQLETLRQRETPEATATQPTATATATATATSTPTPLPPPAALGNAVWAKSDQPIELLSPVEQAIYHSPLVVNGYSQTAGGVVVIRLHDAQGNILGVRTAHGGISGNRGSSEGNGNFAFFQNYMRFEVKESTPATLEVFEVSTEDGKEINKVELALTLRPGQRVIDLETPKIGDMVCPAVAVEGYSNTFEANVNVSILQRNGAILIGQGNATGGTLGSFAEFATALNMAIDKASPVLVAVYETDAESGGQIDYTRVPVSLFPTTSNVCH